MTKKDKALTAEQKALLPHIHQLIMLNSTEPTEGGCIEWKGYATPDGYPAVSQYHPISRVTRERRVPRAVPVCTTGKPIKRGMEVAHDCENPLCINFLHLKVT